VGDLSGLRDAVAESRMTALRYTTEEGGEWRPALSRHSEAAIRMALVDADILVRDDGMPIAVNVLDLPDFHALRLEGERWDADSRSWEPE
jgi:hypothetical protein